MRTFKHPNISAGWKCPICNTCEDKEIVLIGIQGTGDGRIMRAEQFHLDCISLSYLPEEKLLVGRV